MKKRHKHVVEVSKFFENHEYASLMLDYAPIGAYWTREDGSFAWVNQAACDMLGYTREELLALDIFAVDAGATREFWSSNWAKVATQENTRLERWHSRSDGTLIPVEITVRRVKFYGESVHFAFARDLTEQKRADELQRSNTQYMTALFKDSPMPQLIIDPDSMQIVDANSTAETFYGFDELKGRSISSINTLPPEEINKKMTAASLGKQHFFRLRHQVASGNIRDVHVYSGPIEHDGRSLLHLSIEDLTSFYAFQQELEGYRDQLERLPVGVYRTSPGSSGVIVSANKMMCKILDVNSKADIIGRQVSDFYLTPVGHDEPSDLIFEKENLHKVERELVTAKGRQIVVLLSIKAIETDDGETFFEGSMRDLTAKKHAEYQREIALMRLHNTLHAAPIPIMLFRADGIIEEVNTVWCNLTGYCKEELKTVGDWTRLAYGNRATKVREHIKRLQGAADGIHEGDYTIQCKDGSTRIWAFYSKALGSRDQPDGLLISTAIDVTEEREEQRKARQAEAILQSAAEGITITGPDRTIQRVNPSFTRITGYAMEEVVGKNPRVLSSGRQDSIFYERMWQQIDQFGHWQGEIWNRRKNGEVYPEWLSISAIHDSNGKLINYAAVFTDLTELKRFQSTLQSLQRYDPLTGLANKATLLDMIGDCIESPARNQANLVLLVLGLDRFHLINETFGHEVGDSILKQLAEQMECIAGDDAEIARIGGDHFGLLISNNINDAALTALLLRLRRVSAIQFTAGAEKLISVSFTTGIARYPADAQNAIDLLRSAEIAMFQAKQDNPGVHSFFDGTTTASAQHRLLLEIDLRQAIENDQIDVYFQPVVSVTDKKIIGAEGLARWHHPEFGAVSPETFISIAEESGLIGPLTESLLKKAAHLIADLSRRHDTPLRLAFNISAVQLNQPHFVEKILHDLAAAGMAPDAFELELTESTLMQRVSEVPVILSELHEHGVSVSIDDFGTGFSSLAYLQEIKAQTLKIDKRFIDDCASNKASGQLVCSIIAMGHALDMQLIAEGVETEEQLNLLRKLRCEYYQGYLFSKALPIEDFEALLIDEGK